MNAPVTISFDTAYRQLAPADRAFVDDFVARVEQVHETTGRELYDVLASVNVATLPERDQAFLARGLVRAAIQERVQDLTEAANVSPRRIIKEIAAMAFSSVDHYRIPGAKINEPGAFDLDQATPEQRSAVKEIEVEESARTGRIKLKFKLHDKIAALRMLGQIRGLFNENGDPINPDKWASAGAIPISATSQDAADMYARRVSTVSRDG